METQARDPGAVTSVLLQVALHRDLFKPNVINHTSMAIKLVELSKQRENSRKVEHLMVVKRLRPSTCIWLRINNQTPGLV